MKKKLCEGNEAPPTPQALRGSQGRRGWGQWDRQRQSPLPPSGVGQETPHRTRSTAPAPHIWPRGPSLLFQMHIAGRNNMRNIISVPWEKLASQILNRASSICQGDCFDLIHTKSSIIKFKVCEHISDQYTMQI